MFADTDLKAPGQITTRVIDMRRNQEDGSLYRQEKRDKNTEISVWNYVSDRLAKIDARIVKKNGHCFSPDVKDDPRMKQKM